MPSAKALREDPVDFVRTMLRDASGNACVPHPAQEAILRGIKRDTTVVTGRQFGKTTVMGWDGVWFSVTHPNRQVFCIAPTLDQSRLVFNEIAQHFRRAPLSNLVVGSIKEYPFPAIKLSNGTEIHARGANSEQFIRGKRAHRAYVDEAAFIKDSTIREVIEPMFLVTGKAKDSALIRISTPFGQGAFKEDFEFCQEQMEAGSQSHAAFHFTSFDNPHADRAQLERVKARYGEDSLVWRTEYLGQFADSDLAVFSTDDILWAYTHWKPEWKFPLKPGEGHRYVQGSDLANLRDYFVSTVLDISDRDLVVLAAMERYQKRGYPSYKSTIRKLRERYNRARTLIDATSLGESVVQDLSDIGAEGWTFTAASKWEIVQELSRMFQEHRLLIPFDRDIISELTYFQYKITPSKTVRMEASRGHDDIVMSLALSAHLACIPRRLGLFASADLSPRRSKLHYLGDPFADLFKDEADAQIATRIGR
jgi:hypothetical protein